MTNQYKNRKPITITLSPDTIERLEQYANETHCNKSQAISNLIWNAKIKGQIDKEKNK